MPRPLSCIPLSLTAATMLLLAATAPQAQTLLSGDHSIDGQLCVGTDCTDTEDPAPQYGIVIKQTQPGIYFEDTSTAGFPTVDWEIVTGSSFSSADDFLAIRNAQTAAHLLYLSPYAPDNAIYLDNLGQVGLGTSLPQQNLHISGGSTAGIRLEDTDMSPYAWDLNGNSVGFYVYDPQAMNIPFEIRTAAPNGALYIASNGYTGLGTRSPDAPLEVSDDESFSFFRLTATEAAINRSVDVVFTQGPLGTGEFRYNIVDGDGPEMRLNADGDMTLDGTLTTGGPTCDAGCDAVFDPSFERLSVTEHAALMWEKGHLPAIGPTIPGAPINLSERIGTLTNELEHAHIYIETLHGKIERLEDETARIDAQEQVIARLTARLEALEAD